MWIGTEHGAYEKRNGDNGRNVGATSCVFMKEWKENPWKRKHRISVRGE